ncbi:MAG: hypothetical protein MJD61_06850 [Proteobacteria bacterium]|nr:hypothetical protein [Pseudomonadota bacterium]
MSRSRYRTLLLGGLAVTLLGCEVTEAASGLLPPLEPPAQVVAGVLQCRHEGQRACVHVNADGRRVEELHECTRSGEFLQDELLVDCMRQNMICDLRLECAICAPDTPSCMAGAVIQCKSDGSGYDLIRECAIEAGEVCRAGRCVSSCEAAAAESSYVGCEFYAVDLDNAVVPGASAAAQQYAIVVSNPSRMEALVRVEINQAPPGEPPRLELVEEVPVPPGDLESILLPAREVDGSRRLNDGTHTALTSNAYRVTSSRPIVAYQFNPFQNVNVFSNDASLLLPTAALGPHYTVVSWPQTIGHSDDPKKDFDGTTDKEDLRAFLTIVGTEPNTRVKVTLGPAVGTVVGGGPIPESKAGQEHEIDMGPFDVLNLETQGLNADFTGSLVQASRPVAVFVGSEASDVPAFGTYDERRCCADHLEEQLLPDSALGRRFVLARMPSRTATLIAALEGSFSLPLVEAEPEWVRIVAARPGETRVTTTLPAPDGQFTLLQGEDVILKAEQDTLIEASQAVAVLQALPSQQVLGIPSQLPGGDPALVLVPPMEQYRKDYLFLTPDKYIFDFITIVARSEATLLLDDRPLPGHCTTGPADGLPRAMGDPDPAWVIHRCQLSFADVSVLPTLTVRPVDEHPKNGIQDGDGVHTLTADSEVGLIVSGFDRFVSYAYAGGLDLKPLL